MAGRFAFVGAMRRGRTGTSRAPLLSLRVPAEPEFVSDDVLRIGTTLFYFEVPLAHAPPGYLCIDKTRGLLQSYIDLWEELRPRRVFEIGIKRGGSTALLAQLGVERVVSVELSDARAEALDRYIAERGLQDIVHPWYGVNQADRERLAQIVTEEFGTEPLDLVVDDASHLYEESVASFEVLFPHVRPGGLYLLEDWRWNHILANGLTTALEKSEKVRRDIEQRMVDEDRLAPETPMSRLVMELVIARAVSGDVVADVAIGPFWAAVRRGPAVLDPGGFRLDDHAPDHLHVLAPIR